MDTYIVHCSDGNPQQEVVLATLVGEFIEKGQNHGRKVYQKNRETPSPGLVGYEEVDVLLYYWDARDGPAFEGWWFGNKLGGTQVWSHCKDGSLEPPGHGWQIPWDGPVAQTLCIVNKEVQERARAERDLHELSREVTQAEFAAREALHQAREMAPEDAEAEALAAASESFNCLAEAAKLIAPKVALTADLGRKIAARTRSTSGEHQGTFQTLSTQLREIHQAMSSELKRLRALHENVLDRQKIRELEEADGILLSDIMPKATLKTNSAEDLSQTAAIVSEMIYENTEDTEQVRSAIAQTERAVKKSQEAIIEARIFLYSKLCVSKKFADTVKLEAAHDIGKLQRQLFEAQQRLSPLKTVRKEFDMKCKAQLKSEEASGKVALAEVDLDRAEELILKLDEEKVEQDAVSMAKGCLDGAIDHVGKAEQELEQERKAATGLVLEELSKIAPRLHEAKTRIKNLQAMLKEAGDKSATSVVLGEAAEKVTAVTGALCKLDDIECRLQADDMMPIKDVLALVAEAETLGAGAQSSTSMAKMFIQMKALEVKRLTGAAGRQATQQLQEYTREIEAATKRLAELKSSVMRRKRQAWLQEVHDEVTNVEEHLERVREAASLLSDDAELMQLSSSAIREAGRKAAAEDKRATDLIAEVKKSIMARQIEAKGKDASPEVSAELLKLNTRVAAVTAELSRQRKLYLGVDQRISAKGILEDAEQRLEAMEHKVARAASAMEGSADGDSAASPEKKPKDSEASFAEATLAVRNMTRHLEAQARTHQGFAAEALNKLQARVQAGKDRLDASAKSMRDNAEKGTVRSILAECQAKIEELNRVMSQAGEAEAPLADEDLAPTEVRGKAAEFDKAIQAASTAVTNSKVLLKMKSLNVKRLSEASAKSTGEALDKMMVTVEAAGRNVAEMRNRCTNFKNAALKKKATPKPSSK